MVDLKGQLVPVAAQLAAPEDRTGVVDENVDARMALEQAVGERPHVVERREVGALEAAGRVGADPPRDTPQAPLVAADGNDCGPAARELDRGRLADPGARAGDHDHAAGELGVVRRG